MLKHLCTPRLVSDKRDKRRGSAIPLIALSFTVLSGVVGLAIDTGRAQLVQTKLAASLDAAGLAAGSTVSTANLEAEVLKYLNANFPTGALGAKITNVKVTTNADNAIITLSATAELDSTFLEMVGISNQIVKAETEITRSSRGLELVMVLDNTGSMSGSPLTALKSAAATLVNILFGSGTNPPPDLWVGMVPFAQAVNIGNTRTTWLDSEHFSTLNWGSTSWMGCVDARLNGGDITDDPPTMRKFQAYYWAKDSNNKWTKRTLDASDGPNKHCSRAVTPLTNNKSTLLTAINAMTAQGNTHINLGAVWGWRMLSPRWRGEWGEPMNSNLLPLDYGTNKMDKAVVIMTDGENVMDSNNRTAYGYLSERRLGTNNSSQASTQLNTRLTQVCNAMKNKNIYVYTIAFRNPGTTVQNLLRNCATSPDYYFNSPDNNTLQTAFRTIGDSLASLRVSK